MIAVGTAPHPCRTFNNNCQHLCIPVRRDAAAPPAGQCLCKAGFKAIKDGRCTRKSSRKKES